MCACVCLYVFLLLRLPPPPFLPFFVSVVFDLCVWVTVKQETLRFRVATSSRLAGYGNKNKNKILRLAFFLLGCNPDPLSLCKFYLIHS